MTHARITALCLALAACAREAEVAVYWSDGDSGRIGGQPFRLADVDAPEIGGVGSRNGAKCEAERRRGLDAAEYMRGLTAGRAAQITANEGPDKYGRDVVSLSTDGLDIAEAGLAAGHLKPWPHDGARAKINKPEWCK